MDKPRYPVTCGLCQRVFSVNVTHTHIRAAHRIGLAEYRALGFEPANPDFYRDKGAEMRDADHPGWRGGRSVTKNGYIRIRRNGTYVLEHRAVMENHLGRPLTTDEHVHHRDHDKTNNSIENLLLTTNNEHAHHHHTEAWASGGFRRKKHERATRICDQCGVSYSRSPAHDRPYLAHHFCSSACMGKFRKGIQPPQFSHRVM